MEDQQATSLLISENIDPTMTPPEWYVASGIILLHHVRKADTMERAVQIIKMRGVRHNEQIFPIRLGESGLQIMHPRLTP